MAENRDPQDKLAAANGEKQFALQKVYVKDTSFESPNSPTVFQESWKPQINVDLRTKVNEIGPDVKEVVLSVTLDAKDKDRTAFLVEVHQAGLFLIKGFSEKELGPLLGSYCPNLLFPFVRETVADMVMRGGFSQFLMQPVNFDEIYALHVQQTRQRDAATGGGNG